MSVPVQLRTGARLRSQVDATEIIVVRVPAGEVALNCGGHPMIDVKAEPEEGLTLDPSFAAGSPVGKRFTSPNDESLEVLRARLAAAFRHQDRAGRRGQQQQDQQQARAARFHRSISPPLAA